MIVGRVSAFESNLKGIETQEIEIRGSIEVQNTLVSHTSDRHTYDLRFFLV